MFKLSYWTSTIPLVSWSEWQVHPLGWSRSRHTLPPTAEQLANLRTHMAVRGTNGRPWRVAGFYSSYETL